MFLFPPVQNWETVCYIYFPLLPENFQSPVCLFSFCCLHTSSCFQSEMRCLLNIYEVMFDVDISY